MVAEVIRLLGRECQVVGMVHDGEAAVEATTRLEPDIVLLDIVMPIMSGIEAARRLTQLGTDARFVFITVQEDPDFVRTCLAIGALGYVSKAHLATDLAVALKRASEGQTFVSPSLTLKDAL
jgi:DNA-binding NarL/FixJ family response regulator